MLRINVSVGLWLAFSCPGFYGFAREEWRASWAEMCGVEGPHVRRDWTPESGVLRVAAGRRNEVEKGRNSWEDCAMKTDWSGCPDVERDAGKLNGVWVFKGTRVPVHALFQNLEDGATVDDFLEWFPGVTRRQVDAVLEHVSADLLVGASA